VRAAHGVLPVPAPATLRILEGLRVRPGPDGAGELVTPTGAALVRVLSVGAPPAEYVPQRSGFGAGTKDFVGRANALRLVIGAAAPVTPGDGRERLVVLAADLDDASPEYVADAADALRAAGALDVCTLAVGMKKGRAGVRLEVLAHPGLADALEGLLLTATPTIGVRRSAVERRALPRRASSVDVRGQTIRLKVVERPDGGTRVKPEFDDVQRAARVLGVPAADVFDAAMAAARAHTGAAAAPDTTGETASGDRS
jgi:uncharacterized protein (DUF111 family)